MLLIQSGYDGGYQLSREKNHEAIITYEYYQTKDIKWYSEYKKRVKEHWSYKENYRKIRWYKDRRKKILYLKFIVRCSIILICNKKTLECRK